MIVAAILGLLVAASVSHFTSSKAKKACARAADVVMADLKLCKERAIALDLSRPSSMPTDDIPGCGIAPDPPPPAESTGYYVYEQTLGLDNNLNLVSAKFLKLRTVKLDGFGSPIKLALFATTYGPYPTDRVDFYRKSEDDWVGAIRVYYGDIATGYICDIYVNMTDDGNPKPGHIELKQKF